MNRRRIPWPLLVSLLVAGLMLRFVLRSVLAQPSALPRASDVRAGQRTERPARGADDRTVVPDGNLVAGAGVVEPADRETRVAAPLPGRVTRFAVREGQFVHVGDLLVELDSAVERAQLSAAAADVASSRAELARTRHGNRREDVDAANAEADAARERAQLSGAVLERQQGLAPSGAITVDELDRTRRQALVDSFTARVSDARLRASRAGSRPEDVAVAQAHLLAAEARLAQAQAALDRLSVRAPVDGEVLQVRLRAGEYYTPGGADPLVVLGDTRRLRVRIDVDERDVARVRLGQQGFATADAWSGRRFAGHVVEVARRMGRKNVRTDDPTERLDTKILEVVLELDEARDLLPGQRVTGYLQGG